MQPTAKNLAIAAAAFGAATLYLGVALHDERMHSDQLLAETRALHARVSELERSRAERPSHITNPFTQGLPSSAPQPGQPVRVDPGNGPHDDFVEGVAINAPPHNQEYFNKMMRAQVRAHNKQLYAEIGPMLGLSKEEAGKLIDLLTEQQLDSGMSWTEPGGVKEALAQMADKQREHQQKIVELIGADKASSLEDYQQSIPARHELDMLERQFDGADAPLSEEQQKRLLAIMVEERKRVPAPRITDATSLEEHWKAQTTWQANYEESVASQTRTILTTEQLSTYNEYQEWQGQLRAQTGAIHPGRIQHMPAGPTVMFTTAAPAMSADVAIVAPASGETRK